MLEQLAKGNIEIVYLIWGWSGPNDEEMFNRLKAFSPDIIIHLNRDIMNHKPPLELRETIFPPPGKQLLRALAQCESEVMTMMTRADYSQYLPLHHRKRVYYEMVRYWNGIIQMIEPDCIYYPVIPHMGGSDYVLYRLARLYQITQCFSVLTSIGNRSLIFDSRETGCESLGKDMSEGKYKDVELNSLDDDLKNEFIKQVNPDQDATPAFMQKKIDRFHQKRILRLHRIGSYFNILRKPPALLSQFRHIGRSELLVNGIRWRLHLARLKREYKSLVHEPLDLSRPYIYFPLQYQPEASTSPMGDVFVDQLIIAKILSYCLPENWQIYVKEHVIAQWGAGAKTQFARPIGYYQQMAELPNVKIVSPESSSYDLISSARAVATCTGTAGWEAVCRGIPALVFGYPWYMDCPGVYRVQDIDSCKENLSSIIKGRNYTQQEIIDFLYTLQQHSIKGDGTEEKNRLALANAIRNKLESLETQAHQVL